jgi:hypothetical protein
MSPYRPEPLAGDHSIALAGQVAVQADEFALLDIEAPASSEPALRVDHPVRAARGNLRLGGDSELVELLW